MRAIQVREFGGPEVLRLEEVPTPTPGPGEVLLRIHAVGINFADYLMRIGAYPNAGALPLIPGLESAGTVEALGAGVTGLTVGQRVISWGRRSYAEFGLAPAWAVQPAPAGLSFEELATIPVAYGTAWHALVVCANLRAGERVLVHAAGSGVGSAALQLAKALGAWVVVTAGQDWKLEKARDLGADAVINYSTQDVAEEVQRATGGEGVNVVLEGVGKATFPASVKSLTDEGRLVLYGAPSGPRVELDARPAIFRNLTVHGMSVTTSKHFPDTVDALSRIGLPWFEDGRLRPVVDSVYPLAQVADAMQRMVDRALFGKIILKVAA